MTEYTASPEAIEEYMATRGRTKDWLTQHPLSFYTVNAAPTVRDDGSEDGIALTPDDSDAWSSKSHPPRMLLRYDDGRPDQALHEYRPDPPRRRPAERAVSPRASTSPVSPAAAGPSSYRQPASHDRSRSTPHSHSQQRSETRQRTQPSDAHRRPRPSESHRAQPSDSQYRSHPSDSRHRSRRPPAEAAAEHLSPPPAHHASQITPRSSTSSNRTNPQPLTGPNITPPYPQDIAVFSPSPRHASVVGPPPHDAIPSSGHRRSTTLGAPPPIHHSHTLPPGPFRNPHRDSGAPSALPASALVTSPGPARRYPLAPSPPPVPVPYRGPVAPPSDFSGDEAARPLSPPMAYANSMPTRAAAHPSYLGYEGRYEHGGHRDSYDSRRDQYERRDHDRREYDRRGYERRREREREPVQHPTPPRTPTPREHGQPGSPAPQSPPRSPHRHRERATSPVSMHSVVAPGGAPNRGGRAPPLVFSTSSRAGSTPPALVYAPRADSGVAFDARYDPPPVVPSRGNQGGGGRYNTLPRSTRPPTSVIEEEDGSVVVLRHKERLKSGSDADGGSPISPVGDEAPLPVGRTPSGRSDSSGSTYYVLPAKGQKVHILMPDEETPHTSSRTTPASSTQHHQPRAVRVTVPPSPTVAHPPASASAPVLSSPITDGTHTPPPPRKSFMKRFFSSLAVGRSRKPPLPGRRASKSMDDAFLASGGTVEKEDRIEAEAEPEELEGERELDKGKPSRGGSTAKGRKLVRRNTSAMSSVKSRGTVEPVRK